MADTYTVERSVEVSVPASVLYERIVDLHRWSSASATFVLSPAHDRTRLTWTMTGPVTTSTRLMGVFRSMDKMMGPQFEKGLAQLKAEAEGAATPADS